MEEEEIHTIFSSAIGIHKIQNMKLRKLLQLWKRGVTVYPLRHKFLAGFRIAEEFRLPHIPVTDSRMWEC